jgi:hypothetical protein
MVAEHLAPGVVERRSLRGNWSFGGAAEEAAAAEAMEGG